jgi:DNA polymerase III epsilon subunit-like protein
MASVDAMVADAPAMAEVGRTWRATLGDHPLVFHNAPFDLPFLVHLFREAGAPPLTNPIVDTLGLARGLFGSSGNKLGELATRFQFPSETAHRALGDTRTTARLFVELAGRWEREKGVRSMHGVGGGEPGRDARHRAALSAVAGRCRSATASWRGCRPRVRGGSATSIPPERRSTHP